MFNPVRLFPVSENFLRKQSDLFNTFIYLRAFTNMSIFNGESRGCNGTFSNKDNKTTIFSV